MYYSKVVVMSWAVIFLAASVAAVFKRCWRGLGLIVTGAAIVAAGIAGSAAMQGPVGALMMSVALLAATLVTLFGIVRIFQSSSS